MVGQLSDKEVSLLAAESEATSHKRRLYTDKLDILKAGLRDLKRLDRHRDHAHIEFDETGSVFESLGSGQPGSTCEELASVEDAEVYSLPSPRADPNRPASPTTRPNGTVPFVRRARSPGVEQVVSARPLPVRGFVGFAD